MEYITINEGVVHNVPDNLRKVLLSNPELLENWNRLTPIARNEWICWTTIVKQQKSRQEHIKRLEEEILDGKKTPCCWPGCPHRNPKNEKWFK